MDLIGGIAFNKGCYTGQEIISKTENLGKVKRRMFLGVARGVKDLDEGTEVFMENEPMGRVIQSDGEHFLFVLTYEYMDSELYVKDVPVEILPLPYEVTVPASVIYSKRFSLTRPEFSSSGFFITVSLWQNFFAACRTTLPAP